MSMNHIPAKIVFALATLVLLVCAYLSRDYNKPVYLELSKELDELRIRSLKLDDELLKVRGGYVDNYDQLSVSARQFHETADSVSARPSQHSIFGVDQYLVNMQLMAEPVMVDPIDLKKLVSERLSVIDRFKSDLAIAMTAKQSALVLVREFRALYDKNSSLQVSLDRLEAELKVIDASVDSKKLLKVWHSVDLSLLDSISEEQKQYYDLLDIHIINVSEYSPRVTNLVLREVYLAEKLTAEISGMASRLERAYAKSEVYINRYRMYFGLAVVFVVLYGAFQAHRAVAYSREVKSINAHLEKKILRRTTDLQSALAKIKSDTAKKQAMIEAMQIKDRELANSEAFFRAITQNANNQIVLVDGEGKLNYANPRAVASFGVNPDGADGSDITSIFPYILSIDHLIESAAQEIAAVDVDGNPLSMKCSVNQFNSKEGETSFAIIMHDFTEMKHLEEELAHAHKLESVGQLAAGIAHEINTPAQFISDNLYFLKGAVAEIFELLEDIENHCQENKEEQSLQAVAGKIEAADLEYLGDEVPSALAQSSDGIERVTTIVKAMKDYAHPGESFGQADINQAIEGAIIVCRNEWKYTAELDMEFEPDLPTVECVVSDVNQVILNMVVNAAHAISERLGSDSEEKGQIKVKTLSDGEYIQIRISDNGSGMSEEVRAKIFDQFYTTKEVGKGTGQGLSIAYKLVVEKHFGKIDVESVEGLGSTFIISLPISRPGGASQDETLFSDDVDTDQVA